jgi:anti-sigma regulatory factor (Ser/Thr protein kinase)
LNDIVDVQGSRNASCTPARIRSFRGGPTKPLGAAIRAEDASVSHDQLLAASKNIGSQANNVPPDLGGIVAWGSSPPADTVSCPLLPRPESAGQARELAWTALRHWGMADRGDVTVLVVSELVTNALRHAVLSAQWMPGEHPITVSLLRKDSYLLVMVSDPASSAPVMGTPDAAAEGGRGLQVVASCSADWGWQPSTCGGKVVWALLQ